MSLNFQNASSPVIEQLIFFHDWVIVFVSSIAVGVVWYLLLLQTNNPTHRKLIEAQSVEFAWTALPCLVLVAIALPSLRLLYILDDIGTPGMTVKSVGHQWYWSYEYSDFFLAEVDSYMIPSPLRLQDCDNRLLLPAQTPVRVLVTSADVLHSWTVPVLGAKVDAVPGRLNQLSLYSDRAGVFYGQCSEICGSNHSFIPIVVEVLIVNYYFDTASSLGGELVRRIFGVTTANAVCNDCAVIVVQKSTTLTNDVKGDLCQHTNNKISNSITEAISSQGTNYILPPLNNPSFCSLVIAFIRCCLGA